MEIGNKFTGKNKIFNIICTYALDPAGGWRPKIQPCLLNAALVAKNEPA